MSHGAQDGIRGLTRRRDADDHGGNAELPGIRHGLDRSRRIVGRLIGDSRRAVGQVVGHEQDEPGIGGRSGWPDIAPPSSRRRASACGFRCSRRRWRWCGAAIAAAIAPALPAPTGTATPASRRTSCCRRRPRTASAPSESTVRLGDDAVRSPTPRAPISSSRRSHRCTRCCWRRRSSTPRRRAGSGCRREAGPPAARWRRRSVGSCRPWIRRSPLDADRPATAAAARSTVERLAVAARDQGAGGPGDQRRDQDRCRDCTAHSSSTGRSTVTPGSGVAMTRSQTGP